MEIPNFVYVSLAALIWAATAYIQERLASAREQRLREEAKAAAKKVAETAEEVKRVLAINSTITDDKLATIHTLVNSSMGAALKMNAELSRWKATAEPSTENLAAAELAEQVYREHQGKQKTVDDKESQA